MKKDAAEVELWEEREKEEAHIVAVFEETKKSIEEQKQAFINDAPGQREKV